MGQLQYISTAGGSFNTTLAANVTADSTIGIRFLSTGYSDERLLEFGVAFADVVIRPDDWYMYWWNQTALEIESLWTLNEVHEVTFERGLYTWDNTTLTVTGNVAIPSRPNFKSAIIGNLYEFYIKTNDSYTVHLVAWDENGVLGMKDLVSGNFYAPSSGTWTAGPPYVPPTPPSNAKIYLGSSGLANGKIRLGANDVSAIYLGASLLYPPSAPAPTGNWLTFTSNDASARVKLLKEGNSALYYLLTETFQYSVDDGTTWSQYTPDTYITVNLGDSVCFRGNNSGPFCKEEDNSTAYWVFETDGSFAVSGDITSLMNNVGGDIALPPSAFENMFSYSDITSAPNLPSTTISAYCYCQMFKMCTNLVTPPALPATTLANYCYYFMFYGCESMTSAPTLPATNLATGCYANMFQNCESLTTPPALPATTLADSCYSSMFLGSAITTAPALPATILTTGCYSNMFRSCHSLTVGPVLPATTLVTNCYDRMFLLDENLVDITTYATTWDTAKAYQWLDGVAASGTFHNLGMATIPTNDSSGIPTGWTVVDNTLPAPEITYNDNTTECWDGSFVFNGDGDAVASYNTIQNATFYMRSCAFDGDITQEVWDQTDVMYLAPDGDYIIQAKATKSGWTDSPITTITATVSGATECTEEPDPCQECYDACEGDPDCEAECDSGPCGGGDEPDPCEGVDCSDCSNWDNECCGYESYEDCDCQNNGNCPEEEEPEE